MNIVRDMFWRVRKFPGWLTKLSDIGLDSDSLNELEAMDDDALAKGRKEIEQDHFALVRERVKALRHDVEVESPEWVKERRNEYLKSDRNRSVDQLIKNRIRLGKVVKNSVSQDHWFFNELLSNSKIERHIKKIDDELKFRWAPKHQGELNEHEIDRARGELLYRLVGKKPGESVCCLWHPDKNPAFRLYADGKGHCFVCGKDADSIDWQMQNHGLSFADAVRSLL